MPSFVPPKINVSYTFYVGLVSQADTKLLQANPTLAAGDVKVAVNDAAPANLGTLPVVDADFTKRVKVVLSASEMNGDNITVIFSDAAGAEWADLVVNFQTVARQVDDLAFPATSGRSITVETDGQVHADLKEWLGVAPNALISGRVNADSLLQAAAVDAIWDEILTGATHNVVDSAGRRIRVLEENGSYNGFIWIDTVNGVAGTTDFENGTDHNPVNNLADANTLAASIGLSRFKVAPGSSLTFVATQSGQVFEGSEWTLALGGQDISGTLIRGATVTGIATATGTQIFDDCQMGAVTLPDDTHMMVCGIVGTQTLPAGDTFYDRCHSGVLGTGSPQFDFGAVPLNTDLHIRNYSGGVDLRNMGQAGTDDAEIEGRGNVTVNVNCIGGTIEIRGNFNLIDNGSATITDLARYDSASLVDDIFDEDIVAAHGTADSAGLLLRALGALISQRSNNPTLDALLGVTDASGNDVPNQILTGETLAELAAAIPDATPTMAKALMLFYMMTRNKFTSTATLLEVFNDAGAVVAKKVLADDGTTYTETEAVAGP